MNKFILLLLLLLAGPLLAAPHASNVAENLDIRIQTINNGNNWEGGGFLAVKVHISNDTQRPGEWTCSVSGQGEISHIGNRITPQTTIRLNPGESIDSILYIPPCSTTINDYYYRRCSVNVTGTGIQGSVDETLSINSSRGASFLCSLDLDQPLITSLREKYDRSSSPLELKDWPADERVYSSFPVIILTQKYYDSLDQSYRNALSHWLTKGGFLFILSPEATDDKKVTPQGGGATIIVGNTVKRTPDQIATAIRSEYDSLKGAQSFRPYSWRNYIPEHPAILISITLLAFAILVGPLSLFVWAPAGKRHRLFILIPSFSLGFSAMLILTIFFAEGFGGKGTREVTVFLDPSKNHAVILQSQICKTAIITNTNFPLDDKTEFYALKYSGEKGNNNQEWEDITPNERGHGTASGGWFVSRSCLNHWLSASQPTRARVSLIGEEGGCPVVQSTIPCELKEFTYMAPDQVIWKATSLPPGQRVILKKAASQKKLKIAQGHFTAQGTKGQLAPIDTLPSIRWENDKITYQGPIVNETIKR